MCAALAPAPEHDPQKIMSEFTKEEGESKVQMVTLDGKEYKPLADGKYDVIILGSGFKECLLAGLLAAVGGKKVLQIDRNQQYGGDCGSLNLEEMCKRHNVSACVGWDFFLPWVCARVFFFLLISFVYFLFFLWGSTFPYTSPPKSFAPTSHNQQINRRNLLTKKQ